MPDRIGVWGGSFDPVHLGHLLLAGEAVEACRLDRLVWVPSGSPPHRRGPAASGQDRLEMVRLAIDGDSRFALSDYEVSRDEVSYTVETLNALAAQNERCGLVLLIGSDNAVDFEQWHLPDEVLKLAEVAVFERPGSPVDRIAPGLADRMRVLDTPRFEISSTVVRKRVRAGRSIRYWVPDAVATYIQTHHLYLGG